MSKRHLVSQLEAVRSAAQDPGAAYLIRSRLRRALLACARRVAEAEGLEKPVYPGQWVLSDSTDPELVEIVEVCRRIHQRSEHLCAPSESLDVRWEEGWRLLGADLDLLQERLKALELSAPAAA
jgi:hypothetical protein